MAVTVDGGQRVERLESQVEAAAVLQEAPVEVEVVVVVALPALVALRVEAALKPSAIACSFL